MKIIEPSIILVRPQLPENIGMVARAMDNNGFKKLILVNPREKWPNSAAIKSSTNSNILISKTKIFNSLDQALSNFHFVIATSNRKRFLNKPFINDANILFDKFPLNKKTAIIFGPENSGLSNEDLSLADVVFNINTSKSNNSLNLSHAVMLVTFLWRDFFILRNKNLIKNQTYEKIASEIDEELFLCPVDYPYLYKSTENTNILIGHRYHWRTIKESLLTFMTSKKMLNKHWDLLMKMCTEEHAPFETPLHKIYENEVCLSPIPSLAIHCTNVNSVFGLSPNTNWKKIWDENKV